MKNPESLDIDPMTVCPICGGKFFSWGELQAGSLQPPKYKEPAGDFWERFTTFGGRDLRARLCNSCGNVQLFALPKVE